MGKRLICVHVLKCAKYLSNLECARTKVAERQSETEREQEREREQLFWLNCVNLILATRIMGQVELFTINFDTRAAT